MGLLCTLAGHKWTGNTCSRCGKRREGTQSTPPAPRPAPTPTPTPTPPPKPAGNPHYVLTCKTCGKQIALPKQAATQMMRYQCNPDTGLFACMYGGVFICSVSGLLEFYTISEAPADGRVLHASIVDNMKQIHRDLAAHFDPLYLVIKQTQVKSEHTYTLVQPDGLSYIRYSASGMDMVNGPVPINPDKAEIPGVSWTV